jgi:hypothetical protein
LDARTGAPIGPRLEHKDKVSSADFDPKGERIATRTDKTGAFGRSKRLETVC